jgi:hypothetical protein
MSDGHVFYTDPGTGTRFGTETVDRGGGDVVERQETIIAGATAAAKALPLNSAPAGTEYGLPVRQVGAAAMKGAVPTRATATWTTATTTDTTLALTLDGHALVAVTLRLASGTLTGGNLIFEHSDDGANWFQAYGYESRSLYADGNLNRSYTSTAADPQTAPTTWFIPVAGLTNFRIRLNPVLTGTSPNLAIAINATSVTQPLRHIHAFSALASTFNATVVAAGDTAHDSVDAGSPVKIGHKAIAHNAAPTAVAANDRTDSYANRHGIQFVIGGHPKVERLTAKYTGAQTDTVLKTINSGQIFVVTQCSAFCSHANTVDVQVLFEFDDSTDVRFSEHPNIAAGSGYTEGAGGGILAIGADAQDVLVTCTAPTTGSVVVAVSGYVIES